MTTMNPKVDFYFEKEGPWQAVIAELRPILLDCALTEELKWGSPCYTLQKRNIVLIHVFKEYCALLFFKGALLTDDQNLLIQQTENVQSARQIRFTSLHDVDRVRPHLKSYIQDAIDVENNGLKVTFKKTAAFDIPEEFQIKLDADPSLKAAFESLTPGRQRAYLLHFSAPKQSQTKVRRIETCIPHIFNGKGLGDL